MPLPAVTVAIPTYQRGARVERVVRAVLDDPAVAQVVVADDGSTDDTRERLEALAAADRRVELVRTPRLGDHGARAAALRRATGDVVLFLDDDVLPGPGLATGHARRHAADPGLVVAGHMPVREHGGPVARVTQRLYQRYYEATCRSWERGDGDVLLALWAGNVSLRRADAERAAFAEAGGVRGQAADRELGLRLRRAGLRGVFDRALAAEHLYERPLARFLADARESGRNEVLLRARHAELASRAPGAGAENGRPASARALLALARRPRAGSALARVLATAAWASAAAGATRAATAAADLAVAIERRRGAHEGARLAGLSIRPLRGEDVNPS
jgi:hypothetical protein